RAALRQPAPESRSLQLEIVREDVQQRRVRRRIDGLHALIDGECRSHSSPPPSPVARALSDAPQRLKSALAFRGRGAGKVVLLRAGVELVHLLDLLRGLAAQGPLL